MKKTSAKLTTAAASHISDLPRLQRFLCVAELGSLTKAAVVQGTTQSVLSLQMAALERDCGGRLFDRTGRGVALTELGVRLVSGAQALLRSAEFLTQDIRGVAGVPVGEVTVGLLPSLAGSLASKLLGEVLAEFPQIKLRILEGSNGQLDEWLSSGRLDVAVLYRYAPSKAAGEETLGLIDSWLVGCTGDPLTKPETIAFAKLHEQPLILPSMPNGLRQALNQLAMRKRIELKVLVEVDSIPTQKDLVASGFGYAILGQQAVTHELRAGTLQAARLVQPGMARAVTLATSNRHPSTLASKSVTQLLRTLTKNFVTLDY
jgi:LysR family transcriptional regulator, nitrogen assimilation regulatory protein